MFLQAVVEGVRPDYRKRIYNVSDQLATRQIGYKFQVHQSK
jgi:hypothetical protein